MPDDDQDGPADRDDGSFLAPAFGDAPAGLEPATSSIMGLTCGKGLLGVVQVRVGGFEPVLVSASAIRLLSRCGGLLAS